MSIAQTQEIKRLRQELDALKIRLGDVEKQLEKKRRARPVKVEVPQPQKEVIAHVI